MAIALTVPDGGSCSCCGCVAEIRSVTAYLQQHGYDPFDCAYLQGTSPTPAPQTPPYTRYLSYSVSGPAQILACGGWSYGTKMATESWDVDPFTGLTCRSGPPSQSVGYLCNPGFFGPDSIQSCGPTSIEYDCGEYSDAEYDAECTPRPGEGEERKRKTRSESLGSAYTINDVVQNVDTMLARVGGLVYTQMPAYTSGYVLNGTGHSALTWDPGAQNAASFTKGDTWVSKTRLYIKFLADTKYYLNEEEFQASKDQEIIVDAEEGDIIAFTPYCSKGFVPTSIFDYSGTKTTRTQKPPEPGQCVPSYWTAPDCKQYNTRTETFTGNSSMTYLLEWEGNPANSPDDDGSDAESADHSIDYTKIERAGPNLPNCYSIEETISGSCETSDVETVNYEGGEYEGVYYPPVTQVHSFHCEGILEDGELTTTETETLDGEVYVYVYPGPDAPRPCCEPDVAASCGGCDTTTSTSGPEFETAPDYWYVNVDRTSTATSTVEIGETSYTCDYSSNVTISKTNDGRTSPDDTAEWTTKFTVDQTTTTTATISVVFSNSGDDADNAANWDTVTEDNTTGCAGRYESVDLEWNSTALIMWDATYTLPTSTESVEYTAWFHHVLTTDNASNPDCVYRTVEAVNEDFVVVSSGGERLVTTSITVPTPGKDETTCAGQLTAFLLKKSV